ncbi:hypothetical protein KHP62_07455 [Rhodobacteraceae bacterium NNCM2]|nr:hypothetical protein [Coraliihabitans acroporae]
MKLYFRRRKQGAFAFRLDVENRQRRLEMIHIATVNGKGEIRPQKKNPPSPAEIEQIEAWIAAEADAPPETEPQKAIREINLIAQWVAKEAGDEDILANSDPMLLAMHDLRQVIVRRLSQVGESKSDDD